MIALIDYGMGNLLSVAKALESVGAPIEVTDKPSDVARADAVVLPGVGNFGDGMENLRSRGLADKVREAVGQGRPFLGICLGMQMLLEESEEAPGARGLGVFKGKVRLFPPNPGVKVPHMGWNSVRTAPGNMFLEGVPDGAHFYFVHSYYAGLDTGATAATCEYDGVTFAAALGRGSLFAAQFHPEKSQDEGLRILRNFAGAARLDNR